MKSAAPRSARFTTHGFTLVEIMIVVVIIGLLAALAIPAFQRVRHRSQNSTTVNGFRVFSQVFEAYAAANGAWPPNVGPAAIPPGITSADFKIGVWQAPTPIGGLWNCDYNVAGFTAGVSISNFTCDDAQLAEIDAMIDDGDLTTGLFQKTQPNRVSYILEQ